MGRQLDALILPAYDELEGLPSEVDPWRAALRLTESVAVPGLDRPVLCTADGIGVVPTGVGTISAATTTAAIAASAAIDLDAATIISAGIAGGPPDRVSVGSVVVASSIVDWDNKLRFDPTTGDDSPPIRPNPYNTERAVIDLNRDLVDEAADAITSVDIKDVVAEAADAVDLQVAPPTVEVGTNLCGDELFHGDAIAETAASFVDTLGRGPYLATEMEDMGTAVALDRFGLLDRYLSVRAISNHDRPTDGSEGVESASLAAGATVALAALQPAVTAILDRLLVA